MGISAINCPFTTDTSIVNATVNNVTSNVYISSSGVPTAGATFSGSISGMEDRLFRHNLNSSNILPVLYVRQTTGNNWEEPNWFYNDSVFEKDFLNFGTFNFKTGAATFNGWSGMNSGGASFLGFSGGSGRIVPSAGSNWEPSFNLQGSAGPSIVKKIVGDFDVWTFITGESNPTTNTVGLIALSLHETGATGPSPLDGNLSFVFISKGQWAGSVFDCKTMVRDGEGNNAIFHSGGTYPNYLRVSRYGGVVNTYFKTGINEPWHNNVTSVSGREILHGLLTDEVYIGMSIQSVLAAPFGWQFVKSWSPIELISSGLDNIVIRNNTQVPYNINLVLNGGGTPSTRISSIPFFFNFPATGTAISENIVRSDFTVTGYSIGCSTAGSGLSPMSGNVYQRDAVNNRVNITGFLLNSGQTYSTNAGISVKVTGQNRIGIDIINNLSGIQNLSLGIFGF